MMEILKKEAYIFWLLSFFIGHKHDSSPSFPLIFLATVLVFLSLPWHYYSAPSPLPPISVQTPLRPSPLPFPPCSASIWSLRWSMIRKYSCREGSPCVLIPEISRYSQQSIRPNQLIWLTDWRSILIPEGRLQTPTPSLSDSCSTPILRPLVLSLHTHPKSATIPTLDIISCHAQLRDHL